MEDRLARGRDAFDREAWGRAYDDLSRVAEEQPLLIDDLERLAAAAYLTSRRAESSYAWARAHQECARIGEVARAARCAFWIAFALLNGGEIERGGGWVDRGQRLLDDRKVDCVEQGYLRYAAGLRCMFTGDGEGAFGRFNEAAALGVRYDEPELMALARIGLGRCLIYQGEIAAGVSLLDEAMVAVEARDLSPMAVGDAYCTVIDGCVELFDVRRAQVWTEALTQWCERQPELVLYQGECLLHRAELMQLRGTWAEAQAALDHFGDRLAAPSDRMLAAVDYVRGDLHRLNGDFATAEEAYRAAASRGHDPQPGLALLRLAQHRLEAADAAIRRAVIAADDPMSRARLLGPFVEIVVLTGDIAAATHAVDEITALAEEFDQPYLQALAAHVRGTVRLAESDAGRAIGDLRRAWAGWRDLDAPYHAARARAGIALACRALSDDDGADMEFDAARTVFAQLGAMPDVAWIDALIGTSDAAGDGSGLTAREREVLVLVARGKSNRQIADELVISEKTVASHLSHILTKLGLASRTAAASYAYEHGLALPRSADG